MLKETRLKRFIRDVAVHTPFTKMILLLIGLWLLFSGGLYLAERGTAGTTIISYGRALYWGVAAFSTAGIADTPVAGTSQMIGAVWIVFGSAIFFGTIVATITTYFMRPMQRPLHQIINTIEYNLEQLGELSIEELDLLRETVDTLIVHMERSKRARSTNCGISA